jgi:hypothetical protein
MELLFYLQRGGWQVWHNHRMCIDHLIPAHRLRHEYLRQLARALAHSNYQMRLLRCRTWQRPAVMVASPVKDLYCLLRHRAARGNAPRSADECYLDLYVSEKPLVSLRGLLSSANGSSRRTRPAGGNCSSVSRRFCPERS